MLTEAQTLFQFYKSICCNGNSIKGIHYVLEKGPPLRTGMTLYYHEKAIDIHLNLNIKLTIKSDFHSAA